MPLAAHIRHARQCRLVLCATMPTRALCACDRRSRVGKSSSVSASPSTGESVIANLSSLRAQLKRYLYRISSDATTDGSLTPAAADALPQTKSNSSSEFLPLQSSPAEPSARPIQLDATTLSARSRIPRAPIPPTGPYRYLSRRRGDVEWTAGYVGCSATCVAVSDSPSVRAADSGHGCSPCCKQSDLASHSISRSSPAKRSLSSLSCLSRPAYHNCRKTRSQPPRSMRLLLVSASSTSTIGLHISVRRSSAMCTLVPRSQLIFFSGQTWSRADTC